MSLGKNALLIGASLLLCLGLTGCATPSLNISLAADEHLNPDRQGNSYSVLVRFYQLNDPSIFENSNTGTLLRQDESVLGATLVEKKELMVTPGLVSEISIPKLPASKYLGVAAFFRSGNNELQLAYKKVNAGKLKFSTQLQLQLEGDELQLAYR